jgi:hypothetical protein
MLENNRTVAATTTSSVLPGVHQRFVETKESVTAMGSDIESGIGQMKNWMNARFDSLSGEAKEQKKQSKRSVGRPCLQMASRSQQLCWGVGGGSDKPAHEEPFQLHRIRVLLL